MNPNIMFRKMHRLAAIIILLPFFIVIISGLMLQLKKEISWLQPPTQTGSGFCSDLTLQQIFDTAAEEPNSDLKDWMDVDRLDVRPDKGIIKIRMKDHREVQIDAGSGRIIHSAVRRSDIIEELHTGDWFFSGARLWIFLPSALLVFFLWITGLLLIVKKYLNR